MLVKIKDNSWNYKYITLDFKRWLIDHKDKTFYVVDEFENSYRLKNINFLITKNFVDII